jgi:predicted DCC family thiol-disulfide oxidoreductase YuxK
MTPAFLLYDADCGFCRWSVDKILGWELQRRLRPLALQDPEADQLLSGLDPATRSASWHLVAPDRRVYSGGAVAAPLLRLLPGGRPFATLFRAFPSLTERGYRWVARNRDRFGRLAGTRCEVDPRRRRSAGSTACRSGEKRAR